jgi:hypothetical protein
MLLQYFEGEGDPHQAGANRLGRAKDLALVLIPERFLFVRPHSGEIPTYNPIRHLRTLEQNHQVLTRACIRSSKPHLRP